MKTFTDTAGRTWTIALTIDAAKRVKGLLDVNLLELEAGDPPLLTKLGTDVILLCDVIFALVKPQADQQGVTDEQFGAALGGEAILAAQTALYEELVHFFRGLGRNDLAKAVKINPISVRHHIGRLEADGLVDSTTVGPKGGVTTVDRTRNADGTVNRTVTTTPPAK